MELLIIIVLLVIAAETTYLSYVSVRKSQRTALAPVFVDTSVLIDGRITAIAQSGFLTRPLYIPRSVIGELQFLADNADSEKRARARHGLDIVNQLQSIDQVEVVIFPDGVKAEEGVDNRLLSLAKKHNGAVCTIDYNLNKVAVVEGIEVLNVNELAKTLRMAYLPGEKSLIELTQKGNDQHQGVGHLPDGTMVVVENAYKQIGTAVEVEFIRSLQTAAGRMMFAKLSGAAAGKRASVAPASKHDNKAVNAIATKQPAKQAAKKAIKKPASTPAIQRTPTVVHVSKSTTGAVRVTSATPRASSSSRGAKPANTSVDKEPTSTRRSQVSRNNRRRSPEDSMVELANKSSE